MGFFNYAFATQKVFVQPSEGFHKVGKGKLEKNLFDFCAGGGSRTHTRLPGPDFESGASAIPPHRQRF